MFEFSFFQERGWPGNKNNSLSTTPLLWSLLCPPQVGFNVTEMQMESILELCHNHLLKSEKFNQYQVSALHFGSFLLNHSSPDLNWHSIWLYIKIISINSFFPSTTDKEKMTGIIYMQVQMLLKHQDAHIFLIVYNLHAEWTSAGYCLFIFGNKQSIAQLLSKFWLNAYHVFPEELKNTRKWPWKASFVGWIHLNNYFQWFLI